MPSVLINADTQVLQNTTSSSSIALAIAVTCLVWYTAVALVCSIGYIQLWRNYSKPQPPAAIQAGLPHVTIIRPIKGLEPYMYDCLASTFRQSYPHDRLHIRLCIASRDEPSLPILQRLLQDFPRHDAQILIEEEDVMLQSTASTFGPNPKIRNMSRAYREAVGDIVWIIDCNVWVADGVCARMVARLNGHGSQHKNKFVHQLPLVVDTYGSTVENELYGHSADSASSDSHIGTTSTASIQTYAEPASARTLWSVGGGRMEEVFMSSSHAKFYTAINTVLVAPCIVGKSTMFRRSHLDSLTNGRGISQFSENICEDHLIGDLLWKQQVPAERRGEQWGKHALCFGDLAIQPMANMNVKEYWSRRVRWLRVRKFTVTLATLVEPGTESFLCSLYGAYAITTLPVFHAILGVPQTWFAFVAFWTLSVCLWCAMDWTLYQKLHSFASTEADGQTPRFARSSGGGGSRRSLREWALAWLGREALALPIWLWAFYGGTEVKWRGKRFWVGMDMKVHEVLIPHMKEVNGGPKTRND